MTQYGFDFRATLAFPSVADAAPNTYVPGQEGTAPYPQTRNGITFGFTGTVDSADRNSSVDTRFAGICYRNGALGATTFQVDLPAAGLWRIRAAIGDNGNAQSTLYVVFKDNATTFLTIDSSTSAADHYVDLASVERTSIADWLANNTHFDRTFTSTTLNVTLSDNSSKYGVIAYLLLDDSPGGGPPPFIPYTRDRLLIPVAVTA